MALEEYKKKRNFSKTPEPGGDDPAAHPPGNSFVIQKHAATRLHYDFRLELDGVLLSWAVPKGPSLDPDEKRLAVHVEDHPLEYSDFEGVIPKGEYGAGTVVVWDRGTWIPETDAKAAYKKGRMSFRLEGEKLKGMFSIFRIGRRNDDDDNWLLVKKKDEHALPTKEGEITATRPESVITGRTIEEVAEQKDRTWHSNRGRATPGEREIEIPADAEAGTMPSSIEARETTPSKSLPRGTDWLYEIQLEGERTLAFIKGGEVHLISQSGEELTKELDPIAVACLSLGVKSAILDGTVVAFEDDGTTSAAKLDQALAAGRPGSLSYYLFDLLYLDGHDLREVALEERKDALKKLLQNLPKQHQLKYSQEFAGDGQTIFDHACKLGVQGLFARKKSGTYLAKRAKDWLTIACKRSTKKTKPELETPPPAKSTVKLTNPDRVLYDDPAITKRQLAEYYEAISEWMLPHVAHRPLMIVRCPEGMKKQGFYQKHVMKGMPAAIKSIEIEEGGETNETLFIDSMDGLVGLVQMSALEIHTWGVQHQHLELPDLFVFDLDPDEKLPFDKVRQGALDVRALLEELGLESFVKTTGGKGLHVMAPVDPQLSWDKTRAIAEFVAVELVRREPKKYLAEMTKSKRVGKIFIDYFRNRRGATFIAPYSTRKKKGATVAMPLDWEELDEIERADQFDIFNTIERMNALRADPWERALTLRQSVNLPGS